MAMHLRSHPSSAGKRRRVHYAMGRHTRHPHQRVQSLACQATENRLSNRVFKGYDDIVALCCEAWNKLIDQPDRTSIGSREWANEF